MGVAERAKERQKNQTARTSLGGVAYRSKVNSAGRVGKEITDRVNNWLQNNDTFISNYQGRYQGGNTVYRADAADWLDRISAQKKNFDAESSSIKALMKEYEDHLDPDWMSEVSGLLDQGSRVQQQILDNSDADSRFWSQFADEDTYNRWHTATMAAQDILNAADFEQYSQAGAAIRNPAPEDVADRGLIIGGKLIFGTKGQDVGNVVTMSREHADLLAMAEANGGGGYEHGLKSIYRHMTEDEVAIYNYYLGKGYESMADRYLESLEEELTRREAGGLIDRVQGNAFNESLLMAGEGLENFRAGVRDYFGSLADSATGREEATITPITPTQYAAAGIKENTKGVKRAAYDLISTTTNMLPSILASSAVGLINPVAGVTVGNALMGTSSAGNAYAEMRRLGYDADQAGLYGVLVGSSEIGLNYALGGISKLGGKVSGNLIAKAVDKVDNALARFAIDYGGKMASEGIEEGAQSVLEPIFKGIVTGEFEGIDVGEVAYSALLGALSAGLLEGPSAIGSTVGQVRDTKSLYTKEAPEGASRMELLKETLQNGRLDTEAVAALGAESLELDPESRAGKRIQARLDKGKRVSGLTLDAAVWHNERALLNQDRETIRAGALERLTKLGEPADQAEAVAEAVTKRTLGEELSRREEALLRASRFGEHVANELDPGRIRDAREFDEEERGISREMGYDYGWAEELGTRITGADVYNRQTAAGAAGAAESGGTVNGSTTAQNPVTGQNEGISEASEVVEAADELQTVSKKYGGQAGAMIAAYKAEQDITAYDEAFGAAFEMGQAGVSEAYVDRSPLTAYLDPAQRSLARAAGVASQADAAKAKAEANAARVKAGERLGTEAKAPRRAPLRGVLKSRDVSLQELQSQFNDTQRTAYKLLSGIAEATGIDIVLYRSKPDKAGFYTDAQGYFKREDNAIYLDVNAGLKHNNDFAKLSQYTVMRTFSHELTHFTEEWEPEAYNELRTAVMAAMEGNGADVNALIEARLHEGLAEGMTYEEASREVVAEAMTDILSDERSTFLTSLAEQNQTVFRKLKAKFKAFLAKIKSHFASLAKNTSPEARAVKEQVGGVMRYMEDVVAAFDKAALQAVENYRAARAADVVNEITKNPDERLEDADTSRSQTSGIMDGEMGAIMAYKSGGSYLLNAKLRADFDLTDSEQTWVEHLDRALDKLPSYRGTVYRNIQFDGLGDLAARDEFVANHEVDSVLQYPAYTSTSTAADGYALDGKFVVHIEIESAGGKNMEGSGNNFESEVLFPRNTRFMTTGITYDSSGTPTIHLKEIQDGQQKADVSPPDGRGNEENSEGHNSGKQGSRTPPETEGGQVLQLRTLDSRNHQLPSAVPAGDSGRGDVRGSGKLQGVQTKKFINHEVQISHRNSGIHGSEPGRSLEGTGSVSQGEKHGSVRVHGDRGGAANAGNGRDSQVRNSAQNREEKLKVPKNAFDEAKRTTDSQLQRRSNEKRITAEMDDTERADVLKDRSISLSAQTDARHLAEVMDTLDITEENIEFSKYGDRVRLFKKLGEEFSVFKQYTNRDTKLTFSFSKENARESVSKQRKQYMQLAKLLTCLDEVVEHAIGIEVHNRNAKGYKTDDTLKNVYVLAGAFADGEYIVPVKLEVKEFADKKNTLHVAIALESIQADGIVKQEVASRGVARQVSPPSTISIADFFGKINPSDEVFLKYIPDSFLNVEQLAVKEKALKQETVKFGHETDDETLVQYQRRTKDLTTRDVIAVGTESLMQAGALSSAEREALHGHEELMGRLFDLQAERRELGQLYHTQQFGPEPDRVEAQKTLNRMRIKDGQIARAEKDAREWEATKTMQEVAKKAQAIVDEMEQKNAAYVARRIENYRKREEIKKYKDRIKADAAEMTKWILHPSQKEDHKHVPDALKDEVIPFLSSLDFSSRQKLSGRGETKADVRFADQLRKLGETLQALDRDQVGENGGMSDLHPDFEGDFRALLGKVEELQAELDREKKPEYLINRMTAAELKELSRTVSRLRSFVVNYNKLYSNARYRHVYEAGDATISALQVMKSNDGRANGASNFLLWQQMRPELVFERFGEGGRAMNRELRAGQAKLARNAKAIVDFAEATYSAKEVKAWEDQVVTVKLGQGERDMTVAQLMTLYKLAGQEDSKRHLLSPSGGFRAAGFKKRGQRSSDRVLPLSEADLEVVASTLTERQREVADKLQVFMEKTGGGWGNEITQARFGEDLFTIRHYFPIHVDSRALGSKVDSDKLESGGLYALLNKSFTKERDQRAGKPLVIHSIFDVFATHMSDMAQYNALALPVLDTIKWLNYKQNADWADDGPDYESGIRTSDTVSVRDQMTRVYGAPVERGGRSSTGYAVSFVENIIKALSGTEAQGSVYDNVGLKALRLHNRAQVAYNLRVVAQQPFAILRAGMVLDPTDILRGMKPGAKVMKQNVAEMREHSGIALWKSLGFYDVNISRGMGDIIKHKASVIDKFQDAGMAGAEFMDTATWAAIWSACKARVKKQGVKPSDGRFFPAVTELFEDVIYRTQVVDSVLTKNEFMRSKGFFARTVSSFMGEPTTSAGMLLNTYDEIHRDKLSGKTGKESFKKHAKMVGRTAMVWGAQAVVMAAVTAAIDGLRDDDEYETYPEKWLEAFGGNLFDEAMPFGKLPIVSDVYDLSKELYATVTGTEDVYGNPPQSVYMQWWDSLVKGAEITMDHIRKEDTNYTWYAGIYKLLQAASGMAGISAGPIVREVVTTYNNLIVPAWNEVIARSAPSLRLETVRTYDPGDEADIRGAYRDGYLTEEEAISHLLEKGLAEDEYDAHFTVRGWSEADYSRFGALDEAVRWGGDITEASAELLDHGYTQKDVVGHIRGQIGKWYREGEIDRVQAQSLLEKYGDLDGETIEARLAEWSCVVETGTAYGDIKEAYLAGEITRGEAMEMYIRYGGKTEEEAEEDLVVIDFVEEHPACEGISYPAVTAYEELCEPCGISLEVFMEAWRVNSSTKADKDRNGKTISGTKKAKVLDYVDGLDLTRRQKKALGKALGYGD